MCSAQLVLSIRADARGERKETEKQKLNDDDKIRGNFVREQPSLAWNALLI